MVVDPRRGSGPQRWAGGGGDREVARWVRQAQGGDLDAFERLYRKYLPRVYGLCLRVAGDPSLAEELTQDAFVRAWEKLHLYKPKWAFFSWLYKVALNVALTERRSRRRWSRRLASSEEMSPAAVDPGAERRAGMIIDLQRAVATLPRRARMIFVLHDIEGYRHEEIARLAGIATGTSKAQLHRARKLLREALRS